MAGPNIVPYANNDGMLGRPDKKWADVNAYKLLGKELTTTAKADSIPVTESDGKLNGGLLGTHSHTTADVTDLTATLDAGLATKANASHTHGGGDITSAVATATKLATARTISLTGDVTGSASFDGSANASITATVADYSHNHTIANVDSLQTTLDGKVPTGRTVTAGNGLTGGGALTADITLTIGTPGSCSTTTTNSVTSTSHTHAITGVAASSHTHSYVPIPTSSTLPVGTMCVCRNGSTSDISSGGTIAGSYLKPYSHVDGGTNIGGTAQAGTWKNIHGATVYRATDSMCRYGGLFVRTA
jgi:hypothetical protein